MLDMSLSTADGSSQKSIVASLIELGNAESINELISTRTNIKIDINNSSTVKIEHVRYMRGLVRYVGLDLFHRDISGKKNLLLLAGACPEFAEALEKRMLNKSKQYRNFMGMILYAESFPNANRKNILSEIIKNKKHYRVGLLLQQLYLYPSFQKYSLMS